MLYLDLSDSPEELLAQVDPSLKLLRELHAGNKRFFSPTLLVVSNHGREVLKVTRTGESYFGWHNHIRTEESVLRALEKGGVLRDGRLTQVYKGEELYAIRREFIEGEVLSEDLGNLTRTAVAALAERIEVTHGLGYAFLDIAARNVVLRPDGTATLIDFGTYQSLESVGKERFERLKEIDRRKFLPWVEWFGN